MNVEVKAIEHDGRWYVVLAQGCHRRFYQINASAKKFSAQMEKIADGAVPAFVRRLFQRPDSDEACSQPSPASGCQPAMGVTRRESDRKDSSHG